MTQTRQVVTKRMAAKKNRVISGTAGRVEKPIVIVDPKPVGEVMVMKPVISTPKAVKTPKAKKKAKKRAK